MKLISWNVNGLRACRKKGFDDFFYAMDADMFCLQETKMQPEQADFSFPGYECYWHSAVKKGYSGTLIFSKKPAISLQYDFGLDVHNDEGRVLSAEFEDFYLVCVYSPNSQDQLQRLDYRMEWQDAFKEHIKKLDSHKPVIICGDLNVAHKEIDLKNPKTNQKSAGFTIEERRKMDELLSAGIKDSFRSLYPDKTDAYTWWSYRARARERNVGWRIDYFLVSERLMDRVEDSLIFASQEGSDHCPVGLLLKDE